MVGEQRGDQAGVVGRGLDVTGVQRQLALGVGEVLDQLAQLVGVDQVAVVAERDRAVRGGAERRLGVLPGAGPGRGVAGVADREVALERVQGGLVEDLRDQAHVLVDEDLAAVADRDAGRLLAAVLEGVETEVGELGDVLAGGPDAEDAAGVLGALVLRVEVVVEPTVAPTPARSGMAAGAEVGHALIVRARAPVAGIDGRSGPSRRPACAHRGNSGHRADQRITFRGSLIRPKAPMSIDAPPRGAPRRRRRRRAGPTAPRTRRSS